MSVPRFDSADAACDHSSFEAASRSDLVDDNHLVTIGAGGVGGSAVHIAPPQSGSVGEIAINFICMGCELGHIRFGPASGILVAEAVPTAVNR
jgi:hypothetical protein